MNETTTKPGLKFTKQAPRVYTALGSTSYTKLNGATSRIDVAFRIDGRGEEGYRVDLKTAAYLPWESVDGGTPLRTLKAAKAHARRHLGRMRAQQALTPTDQASRQARRRQAQAQSLTAWGFRGLACKNRANQLGNREETGRAADLHFERTPKPGKPYGLRHIGT